MTTPAYPVLLQLTGRLVVVVGGGSVAERRLPGLLAAAAQVRVVAPEIRPAIAAAPVELRYKTFAPDDLAGAWLVFAATADRAVNAAVAHAARSAGIPVNVADRGRDGDFLLPAVLRRGDLTLCAASDGASPLLTALVRERLARSYGPEWGTLCAIVAALRQKRLTGAEGNAYNQSVLTRLLDDDFLALLAAGDSAKADRYLADVLGSGTSLASLGVYLTKGTT